MSEALKSELSSFETVWLNTDKVPEPKLGTKPITGDRYYSKEFMEKEWEHL